ncbi:EcoKI restriction-modification system protein HsdS [Oceanobacillus oncorhynchi]|uniref:EcoKI restriction-modification system protein HsdS n=1 Tax=Oceanobacillus oncorhynchi TaxID=545501 RepID=A0A0A1M516_9BACI|nr:N-6 DNA methylase [Oceanobacillus oncorhynchi]CEI80370.1 EcoKI restriction-modification system protein HsdS [Oceanobacillus oncorhynchi]
MKSDLKHIIEQTKKVDTKSNYISLIVMLPILGSEELRKVGIADNTLEKLINKIKELPIHEQSQMYLIKELKTVVDTIQLQNFINILLRMAKLCEEFDPSKIIDEYLGSIKGGKTLIRPTTQQNDIVRNYLNLSKKHIIFSGEVGIGDEMISLIEKQADIAVYAQDKFSANFVIAELRLMLKENIQKNMDPRSILMEGIIQHQADFVYNTPHFEVRFTDEEYKAMKKDKQNRYSYFGTTGKSHPEWSPVIASLHALNDTGKGAFYLPLSALTRSVSDKKIRERLIESDIIEAIVEFPKRLWTPQTSISTALVLINKNKTNKRRGLIQLINATKLGENSRVGTKLRPNEVEFLNHIIISGEEKKGVSTMLSISDIQEANLLPSSYIMDTTVAMRGYGELEIKLNELETVETVELQKIAQIYRGYNALPKTQANDGNFALVKIADIQGDRINGNDLTRYQVEGRTKVENYRMEQNDIVLSIRGQLKIAIFTSDREDVLLSQNFVGIRCSKQYDSEFIALYLQSPPIQFLLQSKMVGTTVVNLPIKDVKNVPIPIISIEKQRSIVQEYKHIEEGLQEQIKQLEEKRITNKTKAFTEMGLGKTFTKIMN